MIIHLLGIYSVFDILFFSCKKSCYFLGILLNEALGLHLLIYFLSHNPLLGNEGVLDAVFAVHFLARNLFLGEMVHDAELLVLVPEYFKDDIVLRERCQFTTD